MYPGPRIFFFLAFGLRIGLLLKRCASCALNHEKCSALTGTYVDFSLDTQLRPVLWT